MIKNFTAFVQIMLTIHHENAPKDRLYHICMAFYWQVMKRLGRSFTYTIQSGVKLPVSPVSAYSPVFYYSWPESKDLLFIRSNHPLLESEVFVDVGANVGLLSAYLADLFKEFHLFEPTSSAFNCLLKLQNLNPHVNFHVHNLAVGDFCGQVNFLDEGNCSGTSRIDKQLSNVIIPVITLDSVLDRRSNMVMKVDVEGFEEQVFQGAQQLFTNKQIKLVMFERLGRTNLDNIKRFFLMQDYNVFYVRDNGSVSTEPLDIDKPLVNLFAAPGDIFNKLIYRQ